MAAIDGPKLVITIDSSDEEESEKNGRSCKIVTQSIDQNPQNREAEKKNGDIARSDEVNCNSYVYRSKAEEYKMLADLSAFPQLAAMFAFESTVNKKSRKRNQKRRRNKMQKLESQSPNPIVAEKMAANEYPKLTNGSKPLKNDTTSDKSATQLSEAPKKECSKEVQEDKNGGRNSKDIRSGGDINRDNYVYRTKAEEHKMLADLSEFPRLAAMFAFEARMKKKSWKSNENRKRKKKEKAELVAPISNKSDNMANNEDLKHEKLVVLPVISDGKPLKNDWTHDKNSTQLREAQKGECSKVAEEDEHGGRNSNGDRTGGDINRDNYVYRTKAEEYKMLADLSGFPQLSATFAFEARLKKSRKSNENRKRKNEKVELVAPISNKPDNMANNEDLKHEKLVVLPDISDLKNDWTHNKNTTQLCEAQKGECSKVAEEDEHGGRNSKGDRTGGDINRDNYVYRTKAEEHKMLADLSEFPQLSAMFAFEARMKNKSRKSNENRKRKNKEKVELVAPISNKPDNMANNEDLKHEKLVVLPDISDGKPLKNDWTHNNNTTQLREAQKGECSKVAEEDEHGGRKSKGDRTGGDINRDNYVYRTKAEEYKMLADLSGFPQLSAMFAFEARLKKKKSMKGKEKERKKQKLEIGAPRTNETSKTAEVLDATPAVISEKGITQKLLVDGPDDNNQGKTRKAVETTEEINVDNGVDGPDDKNQGKTCKAVETTEEINVDNGIRSDIVIDNGLPFLEGSEGHEENAGLGNLRGLVEILQTEALGREEQKIFEERDDTNIVVEEGKHVDSTKDAETMTSLKIESVERKQNFVLQKLLRSSRYFDFPISSYQMCYNRGKDDHNAVECTMERKKKPCYICGGLEHIAKRCKQGRICFKCNRRGHLARDCLGEDPSSNETSDICLKCGDLGHDMFSCNNEYSPDDLKEIQCSVCKEFGHLCCVDFMYECPKIVTCYKCGQNGHLGSGCTKLLRDTSGTRANSFCKKCKVKGHFARECREYVKRSESTTLDRSFKEKEATPTFMYAPHEFYEGVRK